MADNQPISVVIPLYNKRRYIKRAVDSVLVQSHSQFELIVVDDGSTDGSADSLRTINDPRVTLVMQANAGEGAARNTGARLASHEWVAFLDADDAWGPDFLTAINDMTGRYNDVICCATGYFINASATVTTVGSEQANTSTRHQNYFALAYNGKLPFCASSVAIRRAELLESGGFQTDESMGADQDLWCRLLATEPFALDLFPHATYHTDADGRVCSTHVPQRELPFSRRVQQYLELGLIPKGQHQDARRYIAAHLLHLAKLNIHLGRWSVAARLLADRRTRALSKKRYLKLALLYGSRVLSIFRPGPVHRAT